MNDNNQGTPPPSKHQDSTSVSSPEDRQTPDCISSQDVLQGQSAVNIEHNGNFYRLQTTRQGKLILTK